MARCATPVEREAVLTVELVGLHGDTAVVSVAGEIDLRTAMTLRDHLEAVTQAGFGSVVLDFEQVHFCDASGLNALVALRNRVTGGNGGVWLAGVRPAQRRLFQITGLDRLFPLLPSVTSAVAHAAAHGSAPRG